MREASEYMSIGTPDERLHFANLRLTPGGRLPLSWDSLPMYSRTVQ